MGWMDALDNSAIILITAWDVHAGPYMQLLRHAFRRVGWRWFTVLFGGLEAQDG